MPTRILLGVVGAFALLIGGGLAAGGAAVVALSGERLESSAATFETPTRAIVSGSAEIDAETPDIVLGRDAKLRISATGRSGRPVFLGIARTEDVEAWLAGAEVDEVVDLSGDQARLKRRDGDEESRLTPPADAPIWVTKASGPGTVAVDWQLERGSFTAVLANADARPGVAADITVGARVPDWAAAIGWALVAFGVIGAAAGIVVLVLAIRRSPTPPTATSPLPPA